MFPHKINTLYLTYRLSFPGVATLFCVITELSPYSKYVFHMICYLLTWFPIYRVKLNTGRGGRIFLKIIKQKSYLSQFLLQVLIFQLRKLFGMREWSQFSEQSRHRKWRENLELESVFYMTMSLTGFPDLQEIQSSNIPQNSRHIITTSPLESIPKLVRIPFATKSTWQI